LRESGLGSIAARPAGEISLSHQRQVEIVRSLAMRPGLLLLDEPCAGLMGVEVEQLAALLRRVREAGYSVILVEHNMSLVMTLADHVVVLDQGRVLAAGTPSQVQASPAVVAAYLGTPDES
jgi:ABC-type branched-subunit amino acid transport system ATPase component